MSKRRTRTALVVAFVVMGVAVLGLAAVVYAKYVADNINKNGSASVAKWAFSEDNTTETINCFIPQTYKAETLVGGKIAPGTSGTCEIAVSNANSEVGVHYTLTVSSINGAPQNLELKNGTTKLKVGDTIEGTLAPKAAGEDVTIDWEWPYGTGDITEDGEDTADGVAAGNMSVQFTISGYQVQPTE